MKGKYNRIKKAIITKTSLVFNKNTSQRNAFAIVISCLVLFFTVYIALQHQNVKEYAEQSANVTVSINLSSPTTVSQFLPGSTLIQTDTNYSSATEEKQLSSAVGWLNTFIMGWGVGNPEPSPGQYDWGDIDGRIQAMTATSATPMISFCCAPDWMKGGTAGQTNWNNLNVAPLPSHYQDFANLAAAVAQRYPQVKYFQVWNELKGFYNNDGSFNTTGYMQMYNDVYTAVKAVRPDALIGGPYIGMSGMGTATNNVVSQWLNTKTGGDFIAVDGGFDSTSATNDFTGASFYTTFGQWLRQQPNGGSTLPFGWAEWYPGTVQNWNDLNHFNATMTNAMISTLESGASYALTWGVEDGLEGVYKEGDGQQEGLINKGQPTPFYTSLQDLKTYFGPGTQLYTATVTPASVTVLASASKTMLVNQLGTAQTVNVNGTLVSLTAYQVTVINTPNPSILPITGIVVTPTSLPTLTPTPTVPSNVTATPTPVPTSVPTPKPTVTPTPTVVQGTNLFQNPSFENTGSNWLNPWSFSVKGGSASISQDSTTAENGKYSANIKITKSNNSDYNIQLLQGLSIVGGHKYTITFWAKASQKRAIRIDIQQDYSPYSTYYEQTYNLTTSWAPYTATFTQSKTDTKALFDFNMATATGNVWIDSVSMQ